MTREEAKELDKEYSRSLIYFGMDLGNPLQSPIDKIYDDFEQQLANLKHNYEMQETIIADYKKHTEELELRLSLSDSALDEYKQQVAYLEAQEIIIADKDMLIRGLEYEIKRLKSECDWRDV